MGALKPKLSMLFAMAPIWARSWILGLRGSGTRSAIGKNVSLGLLKADLSFVLTADLVVLPIVAFQLGRPKPPV
jgi:hypothetical protein